jgi:hypothetical protein
MHTVYYLTHLHTGRRLQWYATRQGARIAQRSRNHRLGFVLRIERVQIDQTEYERCLDSEGRVVDATWVIEEDTLDTPDLLSG